jgi:hypothetical protein
MAQDAETVLTIHGLDGDNKLVRADVFSRKLRAFLAGLAEADKFANDGKRLHRFMIEDLKKSSAQISVREKQATRDAPKASGVEAYKRALKAVYNGDRSVERLPKRLVANIRSLTTGADKDFEHGEVSFAGGEVVRLDDFLKRQSDRAADLVVATAVAARDQYFQGTAIGSFDGVLKVIDSRPGQTIRAKLVTTAGEVEIECIVNRAQIDDFKDNFDRRVRIEGTAHYVAESGLPVRVDVSSVTPIKAGADLVRWRGAFRPDDHKGGGW